MKIAIVMVRQESTAGGGHTFMQTLLRGVLNHPSAHQFVGLDWDGGDIIDLEQELQLTQPSMAAGIAAPAQDNDMIEPSAIEPLPYPWTARRRRRAGKVNSTPAAPGLAEACAQEQCDFVWFSGPFCMDTKLPFAMTVWDLEHRNKPFFPEVSQSGWTWDERETFYRRFLPRAAAVIVGTEVGKGEVVRYYGVNPANILVNPFPVPPGFPAIDPSKLRLEDASLQAIRALSGSSFFLYPAQFWPHKNHANLLLALSLLRDAHGLSPTLVLTGSDKGNKAYIDTLIRNLELDHQVLNLGFICRDDLSRLYSQASGLVFASLFGPDNLPPLEAFAHGCPVLASDGDGPREQLGEAALLFDPLNPAEIAACMAAVLLDQPLRQRLSERGLELCQGRTLQTYTARMVEYFDRFEALRLTWSAGYVHS